MTGVAVDIQSDVDTIPVDIRNLACTGDRAALVFASCMVISVEGLAAIKPEDTIVHK